MPTLMAASDVGFLFLYLSQKVIIMRLMLLKANTGMLKRPLSIITKKLFVGLSRKLKQIKSK